MPFLTDHVVTNNAVRAIHGLPFPGSNEPVSRFLAASEDFTYSGSYLEILSATSVQCFL